MKNPEEAFGIFCAMKNGTHHFVLSDGAVTGNHFVLSDERRGELRDFFVPRFLFVM